jgi:hypothetical protein
MGCNFGALFCSDNGIMTVPMEAKRDLPRNTLTVSRPMPPLAPTAYHSE